MKPVQISPGAHPDAALFDVWMEKSGDLIAKHWACDKFDPMGDAELPAVSILVGGAALAGLVPVAEYKLEKNIGDDQKLGRADLWFDTPVGDRSFEFKFWRNQHWGLEDLETTMDYAISCASQIPRVEAKRIYAGTIARIFREGAAEACIALADRMDFCFRFSTEDYELFLIFKDVTGQTF